MVVGDAIPQGGWPCFLPRSGQGRPLFGGLENQFSRGTGKRMGPVAGGTRTRRDAAGRGPRASVQLQRAQCLWVAACSAQ